MQYDFDSEEVFAFASDFNCCFSNDAEESCENERIFGRSDFERVACYQVGELQFLLLADTQSSVTW